MTLPKAAILLALPIAGMVAAQPLWVGQLGDAALVELDGTLHSLQRGEVVADMELLALGEQLQLRWQGQLLTLGLAAARAPAVQKTRLTLENQGGGFQVAGRIDGRAVDWMIDTGATEVVISESLAATLGIQPHPRAAQVNTAAGMVQGRPASLARIQIDQWVLTDVAAIVLPGDYPARPLLGLSALARFKIQLRANKMVLEPIQGSGIIRSR
ncbi:TIGR02281 family clan AA aspartic protease [Litorivicinus lipolyticus]|uniref:TIGR02281 family clan AA aspartic protease n=1 Tax=Litorivicinus lipolyticus TaxID=418701 RepID=A0A5Q2QBR1_9GAMM|nr:TIGR02281 family clan AA aspartic protease [Litorivicinus lipolyticus]QGG79427.1 TIGR02281 family clan AA aspartic protease [Litorivicinus lipolyticus]